MMLLINRLATTPYGTDPEVDAILDGAIVVFNVIQNPDGRVAGTRANGNGFDLNRDFLTQSQPEVQASVSVMQKWLFPDMLDQHGYATPTLIEATTKPHNPGIDYDLWLKWNQPRTLANKVALAGVDMGAQRPVNEWCADADLPPIGSTTCADGSTPGPAVAEAGTTRGPFYTPMYNQLVGLNGSTVEMCSSLTRTRRRSGSAARRADHVPARPARVAAGAVHRRHLDPGVRHRQPGRPDARHARDLPARRRRRAQAAMLPPPFEVENNWMRDYPTAYVIRWEPPQRAIPKRTVSSVATDRRIEVSRLEKDASLGPDLPGRLVRGLDGPAPPRAGRDRARDRRRRLLPHQRALRPARGLDHGYLWGASVVTVRRERASRRRPRP
jgi:hypothetical protein